MAEEKQEKKSEEIELVEEAEGEKNSKTKKLEEELERCRLEKDEYLKGWQRAKADFINYKKEEEKEKINFLKFAEKNFIFEILILADGFEAAFKNPDFETQDKNWQNGVKNIYAKFQEILKNHGVAEIESVGKKFNPLEHEALEKKEADKEGDDNVVLTELQKGYKINDIILRPARVVVGVYKKSEAGNK